MNLESVEQVPLGELCMKIGSGVTPRGGASVYVEHGTALIRSQNVFNSWFTKFGLAYISDHIAEKMKGVTVEENDVLLNITGDSVARSCRVPTHVLPARVNQHVAIIRTKKDRLDPNYLAHYLVTPRMQATMLSWSGSGGTRKALTKGMIERFEVALPPMEIQKKIATTLSAYNDLIENNRRRITLLEEASRQLYREWFIRFRFPGYEHIPLEDGVPDGWEVIPFSELGEFLNGFAFKPHHLGHEGLPIVKIPELKDGVTNVTPFNFGLEVPEKYHIVDGDLLFSWSGTLAVNLWSGGPALLNQHLFKVSSKGRVSKAFLMIGLREAIPQFLNETTGATMKHIRRSALDKVCAIVPPEPLLSEFEEIVTSTYKQLLTLHRQINYLRKARDLLIPKLMSGEIAV